MHSTQVDLLGGELLLLIVIILVVTIALDADNQQRAFAAIVGDRLVQVLEVGVFWRERLALGWRHGRSFRPRGGAKGLADCCGS